MDAFENKTEGVADERTGAAAVASAEVTKTIVVQCRKCKTIIGDSSSFRHSDEQNETVSLACMSS